MPLSGSMAGFAGDIGAVLTRQDISTNLQCGPIKAGQDRAHERRSMSTVKSALAQKSGTLIHVRSGDMVVEALPDARKPGPVGAGNRRRAGRYRDPG